ncbi:MAG: sensor histidine kinase [Betaproteobacteria bacterium]
MAALASLRQAAHRFRHSLKLRLLALFLLLALVLGLLLLGTLQRALQGGWQGYAQPLAADYVDRLAAEIGTPPDLARARAIAERLPVRVRIDGPVLRFDSHPGRGYDHDDDADDRPGGWGLARALSDGHVLRFGLVAPPDGQRPRRLGWIALALLAGVTALAYLAVRRLLRPLDAIGAGVAAYTEGRFDRPIAAFAPDARSGRLRDDELGALANRIDGMAGSLAAMLEAKRTLLLAISHELRSPLTRARLNAELLDDTPERVALLKDLAEMRDLVATLLESERLQQGHAALQAAPLDLAPLLRELAAEDGAEPDIAVEPAVATLDETRIRLMLRNLLSNARRHAVGAPRPPQLFVRAEPDGRWALGLRDHGPGVADEQLARLGEPFHRPDAARTRSAGGVGLGLHLCRQVAQAHGGELRIRNARPGLEVAMVWPHRGPGR